MFQELGTDNPKVRDLTRFTFRLAKALYSHVALRMTRP